MLSFVILYDADDYLLIHLFLSESRNILQAWIQLIIKEALATFPTTQLMMPKASTKNTLEITESKEDNSMFLIEISIWSVLAALMLFIEQEPVSNTAMHLDVNYRHVSQENYTNLKGSNFHEEIYKEGETPFQTVPLF